MGWMKCWAAENQSQGPWTTRKRAAILRQCQEKPGTHQANHPCEVAACRTAHEPTHAEAWAQWEFHKFLHHRHLTPVETVPLWHTWCLALMISCQQVLVLRHANQDHERLKESSWSSGTLGLCCVPHSPWNAANFEAFCKPVGTTHLKTERNLLPSTLGGHQKEQANKFRGSTIKTQPILKLKREFHKSILL